MHSSSQQTVINISGRRSDSPDAFSFFFNVHLPPYNVNSSCVFFLLHMRDGASNYLFTGIYIYVCFPEHNNQVIILFFKLC